MPMRFHTEKLVCVRMTKPPPAPLMDGFDVGSYHLGKAYDVDERLGRYLIVAGYAVADPSAFACGPENQQRRAEDRIRDELHDARAKTIHAKH
jgi:hypothetical protein